MRPLAFAPAPLFFLLVLSGCGAEQPPCDPGLDSFRGACVEPARRYEPDAPLDTDNVVAYGEALTELDLPPPPNSGFRLVAPPRVMAPGEEVEICLSWPMPDITNNVMYAGRLYTTPGLHHSNVLSKPVSVELGENPYPDCHPGAADPFEGIAQAIPDVLFANSTQVVGTETLVFPAGVGLVLDTKREISSSVHFLNTSDKPQRVEFAYDYFTMPTAEMVHEAAAFLLTVDDFSIAPHATEAVGGECRVFGGQMISLMPHTHALAQAFTADLVLDGDTTRRVFDEGAFDLDSDIRSFDPPITLEDGASLRFECLFKNTHEHEVHWGIGDNEMCMLFGYVYPAEKQFVGNVADERQPCSSFQIGLLR
jgi:hypothetical protein